jgi:hypothetical protein
MTTDEPELEILPTMGWVCRTLGISPARVWRLTEQGKLTQPVRKDSELLFSENEVLSLVGKLEKFSRKRARDDGELYAVLFAHFQAKTPFAQVVISEKVSPETVRMAHKEYLAGYATENRDTLDAKTRAQIQILERRESIRRIELETVEVRARKNERVAETKASVQRAKEHRETMANIVGRK